MILRLTLAEENTAVTFPITSVFFLFPVWLSGISGWSIRARAGGGKSRCTTSAVNCSLGIFPSLCSNPALKRQTFSASYFSYESLNISQNILIVFPCGRTEFENSFEEFVELRKYKTYFLASVFTSKTALGKKQTHRHIFFTKPHFKCL